MIPAVDSVADFHTECAAQAVDFSWVFRGAFEAELEHWLASMGRLLANGKDGPELGALPALLDPLLMPTGLEALFELHEGGV